MFNLLDDLTKGLILQELNPSVSNLKDRLFGEFGILPNSATRFFFVLALGWITNDAFHNIRLIRKIRNEFAHNILCNSFDNPRIKSYASSINPTHLDQLKSGLETLQASAHSQLSKPQVDSVLAKYGERGRAFFMLESSLLMVDVVSQLCVLPEARRYRVHPNHLREKSQVVSDLTKETVRLLFDILESTFDLKI